ncbi:hypothetical protein Q3304_08565 [Clostridioides sp. GD02377]|uniref:hypothetical protein n=1 Tax=unclassified Clostridioides TaxID=2635829 RepID=UPI0038A5E700
MNITFSTILDLKVNKENVEMIENKVEEINKGMLDISFKDSANGHFGLRKETSGPSLYFDMWGSTDGYTSDIGVTLEFCFQYTSDDLEKKENIKNILIFVNSFSKENHNNNIEALVNPNYYRLEEKYFTLIKKCLVKHEFTGVNPNEIEKFLHYIEEIEKSKRTVIYE